MTGLTPEQTARLVADRLNGVDTITQAHQELMRQFGAFDKKDGKTQYFILKHIEGFVSDASTVGDHMKNELFALKVKLDCDRYELNTNPREIQELENRIFICNQNMIGLGFLS